MISMLHHGISIKTRAKAAKKDKPQHSGSMNSLHLSKQVCLGHRFPVNQPMLVLTTPRIKNKTGREWGYHFINDGTRLFLVILSLFFFMSLYFILMSFFFLIFTFILHPFSLFQFSSSSPPSLSISLPLPPLSTTD